MKPLRLLPIIAAAMVVVVIAVIGLVFNASFQTWLLRRTLAAQHADRITVVRVSAGWQRVDLQGLHVERNGAVLTVPRLETELPIFSAAWSRKLFVSRLVAKGWTLDLSKVGQAAGVPSTVSGAAQAGPPGPVAGLPPSPAVAAAQAFAGIFTSLDLPVDVAIDGVELEGSVVLPAGRGSTRVSITGGGLGARREGRFDFRADSTLQDEKVSAVELRGHLVTAMGTPRTFTGLATKLSAAARGTQFPQGVKLTADLSATRAAAGETYAVAVVAEGRDLVQVRAEFPHHARRLEGSWKLDVRDADVTPFALGQPLPAFSAIGEGRFDTDASFSAVHAAGRLNATADRLQVVLPALEALGQLKVAADFDLAESRGTFVVQKLEAAISGAEPVATLRSLQPFEINPHSGELRASDPAGEVVAVVLQGVPVTWAKPWLQDIVVAGGHLRGELVATPRAGGVSLRSTKSLTIDGVSIAQAGRPLVEQIDVSLAATADYTPHGWQAELNGLTLKRGDATLLTTNIKAGQLVGAGQPLKATGTIEASLAPVLAQPVTAGWLVPTSGDAAIDFIASLDGKRELQAKIALRNLATTVEGQTTKLPTVSAEVRADLAADGRIAFNAPLRFERNNHQSDLTIAGTAGPEKDNARAIDAQLVSTQLFLEDAQLLAAVLPDKKSPPKNEPAVLPPWAGLHGAVALQLQRLSYADTFEATNVTGRLRIDAGMLKLENLQAGLGDTGRAHVNGTVTFEANAPLPYALAADFVLKQFDPATLFRALSPTQPATVEGRFDVSSRLVARGANLGQLALGAGGDFQLTSKGGVFRGLPVNVSHLVENTSKLAGWIASAGTAISSITGKKDYAEISSRTQAVAEFAKGLNPIPYDQLSVVLSRDAALNTTLKNFTLISPEVRLTGNGTALHRPGSSLLEDSLAMEFTLRARGRQAELLKYLGALEAQADDFGYAACSLPLRVGGTLQKPDTSELNARLAALALEKAGVTEKAADFVNRIFGGK